MRPFTLTLVLANVLFSTHCMGQSTLRDARNWMLDVLIESDTNQFERRLIWADSILASQPAQAAESMAEVLYLFPSFQQHDTADGFDMEGLKLMWFAKTFEVQNRDRTAELPESQLPFAPPKPTEPLNRFIPPMPWLVGLAALGALALSFAWARKRRNVVALHPADLSGDLQEVFDQIANHPTPSLCRLDLINLAFEHGRHPVQIAKEHDVAFEQLTSTELMLAAYLHDGNSMENIESAMEKSRGTLYNMRSQVRKKLSISEQEDLTAALRLRCTQ